MTLAQRQRPMKMKLNRKKYEEMSIDQLDYLLVLKGHNKTKVQDKIRQLNREWNKELTTKSCQSCGYNKHVELAHLKAIADFDKHSLIKEVNAPDNILVLCPNCHWEFDSGMLDLINIGIRRD